MNIGSNNNKERQKHRRLLFTVLRVIIQGGIMIKLKFVVLLIAVCFFLPSAVSFAAEIGEDEIVDDRIPKIYIDEEDEYTFFQRGNVSSLVALSVGYDDNSQLDSERNGDAFSQVFFKTSFISPITRDKKVNGILGYELMTLLYGGEESLDVIKNSFNAGIENKINKEWELRGGYRFDSYAYINSGSDKFYVNALYGELKQNLPQKMYHQLGYEAAFKNYPSRHIRLSATVDTDKKRDDWRNSIEYEIGKYFAKDLVKLSYEYFDNNSNEHYLNYYDYDSYKFSASLTHLFSDKVFSLLSFSRQYRDYRSRTLTQDTGALENDRTYLFAAALYYNLNESLTVGLSYTYRQNNSNEPVENYSGSLIAISSYYRF